MAIITATWTNAGLALITQRLAAISGSLGVIDSFKVGEGGWQATSTGKTPRTPDPTLTNLDCIQNPGRYPADSLAHFQKSLTGGDMSWTTPGLIVVDCLLGFGDFNDDGSGHFPEIYEIGLFSGSTMMAYGTFPVEIKSGGVQIPNTVTLVMAPE